MSNKTPIFQLCLKDFKKKINKFENLKTKFIILKVSDQMHNLQSLEVKFVT